MPLSVSAVILTLSLSKGKDGIDKYETCQRAVAHCDRNGAAQFPTGDVLPRNSAS